MRKETKQGGVPTLRFPEFLDSGEWEEKTLREISHKFISGGTPNTESLKYWMGTIPWITGADIFNQKVSEIRRFISEEAISNSSTNIVPKDSLLIVTRTGVGKVAIAPFDIAISQDFTGVILNPNFILTQFLYQFLAFKEEILTKNSQGTSINGVKREDLANVKFTIPSASEQQKIAGCLSTLDDLISAQDKKIQALQAHKKGLMRRLFPAEGESVPRFRFGEFEGEWVEKALEEVADIITGTTPSTSESNNYGGKRMFVTPADINDERYISHTKTTLTEKGYSHTRHIKINSVMFVCIGSTIGKVAQNKFECATNQQINSLVPHKNYSNEFIYSILENNSLKISVLAGVQAVPIINKSTFSSIKLKFPFTEVEQQKIADCLSSLDELIAAQTQKLEVLKKQKKGLMQQLFPN